MLGASLCFAIARVLAVKPFRVLGAIRFNGIRMLIMAVGLFVVAMVSEGLPTPTAESLLNLKISDFVGIFLGDTFYFAGLRRDGQQLNAVTFVFNAPLTVVAGIFSKRGVISPGVPGVSWSKKES